MTQLCALILTELFELVLTELRTRLLTMLLAFLTPTHLHLIELMFGLSCAGLAACALRCALLRWPATHWGLQQEVGRQPGAAQA